MASATVDIKQEFFVQAWETQISKRLKKRGLAYFKDLASYAVSQELRPLIIRAVYGLNPPEGCGATIRVLGSSPESNAEVGVILDGGAVPGDWSETEWFRDSETGAWLPGYHLGGDHDHTLADRDLEPSRRELSAFSGYIATRLLTGIHETVSSGNGWLKFMVGLGGEDPADISSARWETLLAVQVVADGAAKCVTRI